MHGKKRTLSFWPVLSWHVWCLFFLQDHIWTFIYGARSNAIHVEMQEDRGEKLHKREQGCFVSLERWKNCPETTTPFPFANMHTKNSKQSEKKKGSILIFIQLKASRPRELVYKGDINDFLSLSFEALCIFRTLFNTNLNTPFLIYKAIAFAHF